MFVFIISANAHHFRWFGHTWSHAQAHKFNFTGIKQEMLRNKQFAQVCTLVQLYFINLASSLHGFILTSSGAQYSCQQFVLSGASSLWCVSGSRGTVRSLEASLGCSLHKQRRVSTLASCVETTRFRSSRYSGSDFPFSIH